MKRYPISLGLALVVLMAASVVLGQDAERAGRTGQSQLEMRERFRDMSEAEREKVRAEMREVRERWQNMSEADREKLRAEMRERYGSRPPGMGREEQLRAIKAIEDQVAKLKAAVEATSPENRIGFRGLSDDERAELRKKMMAASRERQTAIRTIEQELAKLRGRRRPGPDPREQVGVLRAIHKLAVKENATQTAARLEKLIASYERESPRRGPRPERPPRSDAGQRARPFALKSFDGKAISLSDYGRKIVVLEWLNFECPFVRHHYEKASTMIDLARKYKDENVVWLAINSTNHTTAEANKAFAAKHKLPDPILDDRSGKVGRAYGAATTPHMFVIDPRGNIVYEGAIDNSPLGRTPAGEKLVNYVGRALAELVAGKDIGTPETKPYGCSVKYAK